jgi:hypothetical protein
MNIIYTNKEMLMGRNFSILYDNILINQFLNHINRFWKIAR